MFIVNFKMIYKMFYYVSYPFWLKMFLILVIGKVVLIDVITIFYDTKN